METDLNSPQNLCSSIIEKLKLWQNEVGSFSETANDNSCNDIKLQYNQDLNVSIDKLNELSDVKISEQIFPNDIKYLGNTLNELNGNNLFIKQFIHDGQELDEPVKKFQYLKKRQGLKRYGSKKFVGFKKKTDIGNLDKSPAKVAHSKSLRNFEQLEELVEHPSFTSTSSKINSLLQDSMSSTPIRGKSNTIKTNLENKFKMSHPINRNMNLNQLRHNSNNEEIGLKPVTSNIISKSQSQNINEEYPSNESNPKLNKVHFPQQGVKVHEYETLNDSTDIMLNDSDLVTFSDLDGLVNFNRKNLINSSDIPVNCNRDKYLNKLPDKIFSNNVPTNSEDIKTLKILLSSKIEYLNKEIMGFRNINDYLQNLIEELKVEKQNCLDIQREVQDKLRNCTCEQKKVKISSIQNKSENNLKHSLISKQLTELMSSLKSVDQDIKEIQQNMPKPKPFCNLKLIPNQNRTKNETTKKPLISLKSKESSIKNVVDKIASNSHPKDVPSNCINSEKNVLPCDKEILNIDDQKYVHYPQDSNEFPNKSVIYDLPEHISSPERPLDFSFDESANYSSNLYSFNKSANYKKFHDKIVYYFPNKSTITKHNDGREVRLFADGQKETYYPDDSYEVIHADNSMRSVYSDGTDISVAGDGTIKTIRSDGSTTIQFVDGQREDHDDGKVQRTYPDGTVKILYQNGTQKTIYANGKIRIKDKYGNLIS